MPLKAQWGTHACVSRRHFSRKTRTTERHGVLCAFADAFGRPRNQAFTERGTRHAGVRAPRCEAGSPLRLKDTIAAISTPSGRGGIGIIRISGGEARAISEQILRLPTGQIWKPWTCTLAEFPSRLRRLRRRPRNRDFLRRPAILYLPRMSSKSRVTARRPCCDMRWSAPASLEPRLAEPGEFTLRAYLNGRVDLPQAEAVRDLIDATTLYQARIAAQQAEGSVSAAAAFLGERSVDRADRAARSRHRFRRRRHRRRAVSGDSPAHRAGARRDLLADRQLLLTASWYMTALRWPLPGVAPMPARAASSTGFWNRTAPS